ncbi:MAG: 4-hydroxythreonine-4-phosphate dehydrogenase PdxA [Deltaproteobacteria bacterium]|nr:4-hydroxythreonine-4-phosphate dehydrogenase PdxA [Deltaproteobacteria bacterium]
MIKMNLPISPSPHLPNGKFLPKVGITMGDPTGIGPEIIAKALSMKEPFQACRPVVFGDEQVLLKAIRRENLSVQIKMIDETPKEGYQPGKIFLFPSTQLEIDSIIFSKPDRKCGEAMVRYVEDAVKWVKAKKLDAITTCPINKKAINAAGYSFSGHTELLTHLTQSPSVAMMFIGSKWKVVLVTTHLPLKEVSKWITRDRILDIIQLTEEGLRRYFGISHPRLAILGLNPHCGEEELLGVEEKEEIIPAIEEAKSRGIEIEGPFPADSFFDVSSSQPYDAVIAMYHDQGLIPVKAFGFKESINFTLGLPFVRTSVGHGTGYDIAGRGLADPANLIKAIVTAAILLSHSGRKTLTFR